MRANLLVFVTVEQLAFVWAFYLENVLAFLVRNFE